MDMLKSHSRACAREGICIYVTSAKKEKSQRINVHR